MINKVDAHKKLCKELTDTYIKKNHDYGDAFGKSIEEHGLIAGVVRMEDKFNRLKNIIKTNEVLVGDEKLEDTLLDLANYTIMMLIELQSPIELEHVRPIESVSVETDAEKFGEWWVWVVGDEDK